MKFEKLVINHKEKLKTLLQNCNNEYSTISFVAFFHYLKFHSYEIMEYSKNTIVLKFIFKNRLAFEIISCNASEYIDVLKKLKKTYSNFELLFVEEQAKKILEKNNVEFEEDEDLFEYVYLCQDLKTYSGKSLQSKRNYLKRFIGSYDYEIKEYQTKYFSQVEDFLMKYRKNVNLDKKYIDVDLNLLKYYNDLNLKSVLVFIDNQLEGIGVYSKNGATIIEHIEKSNYSFVGISAFITNYIAKVGEGKYLSKEEDYGFKNIRLNKQSYKPYIIRKRYKFIWK